MLLSRCGSRTGVQSSAKDSGSLLSWKDLLQKIPNKLSSQRKRKAPSKKHHLQTSALVVSALPWTTRLVSRLGWVLRLLPKCLNLENGTSMQAFFPLLCHSLLPSYPSCSLTAVQQTSCQCKNAAALGYTLNPLHIHVWTCSCTTLKKGKHKTQTLLSQLSAWGEEQVLLSSHICRELAVWWDF